MYNISFFHKFNYNVLISTILYIMGLLWDLVFSIPLGIIYTIFFQKLGDIMFCNLPYNDKYQKYLTFLFLAGVIGIVLAQTIFTYNKTFKNQIIKHGLIIGGIILILYPTLTYWDKMTDETKLLVIGIALGGLLWYSYKHVNTPAITKKEKQSKT